jgi:hypothetical protein
VLLQKIAEGFVCKLLKILHPILGQQIERVPSLIVELYPFARHQHFSAAGLVSITFVDPSRQKLLRRYPRRESQRRCGNSRPSSIAPRRMRYSCKSCHEPGLPSPRISMSTCAVAVHFGPCAAL